MGYSNTTKLALRKDDGDEPIVNWREHNNSNLDSLDTTISNLVDAITNAKALLGQLGLDQNGNPIINAATARGTLDAAQSENAAGSLYDAEQAIGVNAGNIATNTAAISSLQNSALRFVGVASGNYDSYTHTGLYKVSGGMTTNKPEQNGSTTGTLIVCTPSSNESMITQLYFSTGSKAFFRIYTAEAGWISWVRLATA